MKKLNGKRSTAGKRSDAKPHAQAPAAIRLRVAMKSETSWTVPLEAIAAGSLADRKLSTDSGRIGLSLMRSITQSGLRRGNVWGR